MRRMMSIFCERSSPVITDCRILGNTGGCGGGIFCFDQSSPLISDCTIARNAGSDGGGICCAVSSSPTISGCTILQNRAEWGGGGIHSESSSPSIVNCTITGNLAGVGGGIDSGNSSSASVFNCVVTDNQAAAGGGIYCSSSAETLIKSCTITGNSAWETNGGGVDVYRDASATIENCILWGNSAPQGAQIALASSWGGEPIVTVRYCDVEGGEVGVYVAPEGTLSWLTGNIDDDPLFMAPQAGDYRLSAMSPCIDVGSSGQSSNDLCFPPSLGTEHNDMGAYGGPDACEWCGDRDEDGTEALACGGDDCIDTDPKTYPGALDICDGIDNDCDGIFPDGDVDADLDGWLLCDEDCDDDEPQANPGLEGEDCREYADGIDNDCDGLIDNDKCQECFVGTVL